MFMEWSLESLHRKSFSLSWKDFGLHGRGEVGWVVL